jgi:hypothetical protein
MKPSLTQASNQTESLSDRRLRRVEREEALEVASIIQRK